MLKFHMLGVCRHVLNKERAGDYRGQTVQLIPHVTREIVEWVEKTAAKPVDGSNERPDICILEVVFYFVS